MKIRLQNSTQGLMFPQVNGMLSIRQQLASVGAYRLSVISSIHGE